MNIKKENVDKNYNTILTEKSLNDLVKSLKISKWFSFALETTSIHAMKADIVGLSFSNKADTGWYIPIQYLEKEKNNFGENDLEFVLELLKTIL